MPPEPARPNDLNITDPMERVARAWKADADRLAVVERENAALRAALNTILTYITPYQYARRAGADIVFPETDVAAIARCARAALNAATAPAAPGTAGDPTGGTYRKVVD